MRQITKIIWFFNWLSNNLRATVNIKPDSIKINQNIKGLYDWYLSSIKEKKYSDFKPSFVESENGMTTLDYPVYFDNLKTCGFSDPLII